MRSLLVADFSKKTTKKNRSLFVRLAQVEIENFSPSTASVTISAVVYGPDGSVVGQSKATASVPSGPNMSAVMLPDIAVADATLWHVGCLDCPPQPL